jgi:hypothetical protein
MKLGQYLEILKGIATTYGNDLEVVYGVDDEGNDFQLVHWHPSAGCWAGRYFIGVDDEDFTEETHEINCVCVN